MNLIKAVFFDLDGTLIDTEKIYNKFWQEAAASLGYKLTKEMALELRSLDNGLARAKFVKWFNDETSYDKIKALRIAKMDEYMLSHKIMLKSGAIELLRYLNEENIPAYVVTATKKDKANELLESAGISSYIKEVISTKNVTNGKPNPEVYLKALEISNLEADEVIAIEDSPNGLQSAYDAGLIAIYIPDLTPFDEKTSNYCYASFDSLEDVISYIEVSKIVD